VVRIRLSEGSLIARDISFAQDLENVHFEIGTKLPPADQQQERIENTSQRMDRVVVGDEASRALGCPGGYRRSQNHSLFAEKHDVLLSALEVYGKLPLPAEV
jgi:hypothetical protein